MKRIKQIVQGLLAQIAVRLPPKWGMRARNLWFWGRPVLDYLEFHAADQCNMNCAGCTHYSPYLERHLVDVEEVRRDFALLKERFAYVRKVRIMGGEPLLHPDVTELMRIVRTTFPMCRVTLATNGLLLARQTAAFWETCRDLRIGIDVTVYPPMVGRGADFRELCRRERVALRIIPNGEFLAKLDVAGRQPMKTAFRTCRERGYCPILRDGRIYHCAEACYAEAYNRVAGTRLPAEEGMDLATHTGREILEYLMCPIFMCCHCSPRCRTFTWHNTEIRPEDWHA